ncbi:MAG: cysteine peptidase family C39 domain-containing protein [Erysipelotrichaceae bacterium]|nr:cysteine peptidase family C39 domain-containing protein [Erysipelotrichaceae bacterium]
MRRYKYYIQDDPSSCGVYCMAMILDFHGRHENVLKLKQAINPDFMGSSVAAMIGLLKDYNIEAKGYQSDLTSFLSEASMPCVVLIDNQGNNHFVVVYKKYKSKLLIGDPEKGKRIISLEEFAGLFKGVVINTEHVGRFEPPVKNGSLYGTLLSNLRQDGPIVARLVGFSLLISLMTLVVSGYYNNIFQRDWQDSLVMVVSVGVVGILALKSLLEMSRSFLFLELEQRIMERIVLKTMENLVYLQPFFYRNLQQGKTLAKINNLFVFSATLSSCYTTITFDAILATFLLGTIGFVSWWLLALIITVMGVFGWCLYKLLKRLKVVENDFLDDEEELNETVLELMGNYQSIRQYGLTSFIKKKLNFQYCSFSQNYLAKNRIQVKIGLFGDLVVNLLAVMMIFLATLLPFDKSYLILVYLLFTLGARFLMNIVTFCVNFPEMANIFAKYQLLLPDKPQSKRRLKKTIESVECANLSFGYGRNLIFDQFNHKFTKNTLIVGAVGTGKTTLSHLLSGDLDAQAGEILVNGNNLNEYDYRQLKKRIVYLDKQPVFFNESLRFNILLGSGDEKKMVELLTLFHQDQLLKVLECQLENNFLSAGMAQIVMIVRTLCQGADVIIFDEALSNVDLPTAKVIVDYLDKSDIIVLMITHNTKLMNLCSLYDRMEII